MLEVVFRTVSVIVVAAAGLISGLGLAQASDKEGEQRDWTTFGHRNAAMSETMPGAMHHPNSFDATTASRDDAHQSSDCRSWSKQLSEGRCKLNLPPLYRFETCSRDAMPINWLQISGFDGFARS